MIGIGELVRVETFCCDTIGELERQMNLFMEKRKNIEVHDVKYSIGSDDNHYAVLVYRRVHG